MEKRHKERERRTCSAFQSKALIVICKYDVTLEPPGKQMKCETCCNRAGGEMGEMFAWQKQASDLSLSLDQQPRSVSPAAAVFSLSQVLLISTWDQNIGLSQTKWGPSSLVNGVTSLKKDISKLHFGVEQNSWEFENLLFTFENVMGKYKFSILKLGIWDWGLGAEAHILSHWGALIDLDGMELNFGADLSRIARNCIPNQSFSNHLFQSNTFVQSQEVHPGNIRLKFQIFRL